MAVPAAASYFDHHICLLMIQKGFGAMEIFRTPFDYGFFLQLIRSYKKTYQIQIFSFCLLPSSIYFVAGGKDARAVSFFLEDVNRDFCDYVTAKDAQRSGLRICRARLVAIEDSGGLIDAAAFVDSIAVKCGRTKREADYEWCSLHFRARKVCDGMLERIEVMP